MPYAIHFSLVWPTQIKTFGILKVSWNDSVPYFYFFQNSFCVWYYLKTPNLRFLNLVITQHNIISNFWNFEYFLNRLCPIFFFFKMVLVCWHCLKTSKCVSEPDQATMKYLNKFSKFHKFLKMDVSFKNPS